MQTPCTVSIIGDQSIQQNSSQKRQNEKAFCYVVEMGISHYLLSLCDVISASFVIKELDHNSAHLRSDFCVISPCSIMSMAFFCMNSTLFYS